MFMKFYLKINSFLMVDGANTSEYVFGGSYKNGNVRF